MREETTLTTTGERAKRHDRGKASLRLKLFRLVLKSTFRVVFKVRVAGPRNVLGRPLIICANHLGWTDTFLVLLFFPIEPRIYILGERQVAHISAFRNTMIRWLQIMIPLDRGKPREALREMSQILADGGSLLIFPEGHLGTVEGDLLPLQNGAAHLSVYSDVPILPVGLTGTSQLWLRRTLKVAIGKPIEPGHFTGDLRTRMSAINAQLEYDMRALLPGDGPAPQIKLLRHWLTELL